MNVPFPFGRREALIVPGLKQRRRGSLGSCLGNASVSLTWEALSFEAPPQTRSEGGAGVSSPTGTCSDD